jgi:hypothetical protein
MNTLQPAEKTLVETDGITNTDKRIHLNKINAFNSAVLPLLWLKLQYSVMMSLVAILAQELEFFRMSLVSHRGQVIINKILEDIL